MMRVVVSGAAGFVGRAVVEELARRHHVIALDRVCPPHGAAEVIEGDIGDADVLAKVAGSGCDALVHLATIPGGAAEQDPALAWRVNVEGSRHMFDAARAEGRRPRIIFASSIAALGAPLPDVVTDATEVRPRLLYGAHKAMIEQWLGTLIRRGDASGLSVRLSGIVARPQGPSGLKSAFMSDVFHAALSGRSFVAPVSATAPMWMMSVRQIARNLAHAIEMPLDADCPTAVTLPAVRATMGELIEEIARQAPCDAAFARYAPEPAIEEMFGAFPRLDVHAAPSLGFADDGSLAQLVASAIDTIRKESDDGDE